MLLTDLAKLINGVIERGAAYRTNEMKVVVALASPSIGFCASTPVKHAHAGFDWDSGSFILTTEDRVVKKTQHEDAFDAASDLLMYLATKPSKRESYETRMAKSILKRTGYTEEQFDKYRHLFHEEKK